MTTTIRRFLLVAVPLVSLYTIGWMFPIATDEPEPEPVTEVTPAPKKRETVYDRVMAMDEDKRGLFLQTAIVLATDYTCEVRRNRYIFTDLTGYFYYAHCSDGKKYVVRFPPDEYSEPRVLDCDDAAMFGIDCSRLRRVDHRELLSFGASLARAAPLL